MRVRKNWKKAIVLSMVAAMTMVIAGCGGSSATKEVKGAAGQTAKIGLLDVLTGNAAAYGKSVQNGVMMAVDEINKNGKEGIKLEVITEDTGGDKNAAINGMNKLVHKDQVVAVIGPLLSGEAFASGGIAQKAGVAVLGATLTADGITDIGDTVFRTCLPESQAIPAAVKRAYEVYGFKRAAILYSSNNDQLVSGYKSFVKVLDSLGVSIVDTETFADKDTDFSAQLTKIEATHPDVLIIAAHYKEGTLLLKKAREMGMTMPVIGSNGFNSPVLIDQAGKAAEGVIVGSPWFPEKKDEKVQAFRKKYKERFGEDPDQFAAQGYDAVYMAYRALEKSGSPSDRKKFREALKEMTDFVGVAGHVQFDEKREPIMDVNVLIIRNGRFEAL